jgi:hypothetical protein
MSHDIAARVAAAADLASTATRGQWVSSGQTIYAGREGSRIDLLRIHGAGGPLNAVEADLDLMAAAPDLAALVAELWAELARLTAERDRLARVAAPLIRWIIVRAELADSDGWHLSACESPHRFYWTEAEAEKARDRAGLLDHAVVPVHTNPRSAWLDRAVVPRG